MQNMTELTAVASQMAMGLLDGTVDVKTACEVNNTLGKIINAQKCILAGQIASQQGMKLSMPYLDVPDTQPVIDIKPKPRKLSQRK